MLCASKKGKKSGTDVSVGMAMGYNWESRSKHINLIFDNGATPLQQVVLRQLDFYM